MQINEAQSAGVGMEEVRAFDFTARKVARRGNFCGVPKLPSQGILPLNLQLFFKITGYCYEA